MRPAGPSPTSERVVPRVVTQPRRRTAPCRPQELLHEPDAGACEDDYQANHRLNGYRSPGVLEQLGQHKESASARRHHHHRQGRVKQRDVDVADKRRGLHSARGHLPTGLEPPLVERPDREDCTEEQGVGHRCILSVRRGDLV